MLTYLKKNKDIRIIIVEKTDRLYRNFKDYVRLDEFQGLEVHLVKEGTILSDNSKSHDKFIHGIKVLMAKNYIDNLSEEVKKGFNEKCEQGEYPANPPLGYKRLDTKTILIDTVTAPFVLRAFNLYSEGDKSLQKVIEQLHYEGFKYKENKSKIGKATLEHILKNQFYTGQFVFGGKLYQGIHEPLINRELFDKVQLAFKKDNKPRYRKEHNFAFAGFLTCGECGSTITADIKKNKYIYYHCTHGKNFDCSQDKYIPEEKLEKLFEKVVFDISLTTEQKEWIIQALKESNIDEQEYSKERIEKLNIQCQKLRDRISKIYLDKLDGIIAEEFWLEKHNEWTSDLDRLQNLIKAHDKANKNYLELGIQFLSIIENVKDLYFKQDNFEKVKLLKILLSNCTIKNETIDYIYNKPFDILANGLSCTKTLGREDSNPRWRDQNPLPYHLATPQ